MFIASIDCGTTNSRVYIVDNEGTVLGKSYRNIGVKDTALSGSRDTLKNAICETFEDALTAASLKSDDISMAVAAGMITSELGLLEIPHLHAPAGTDELAKGLVQIQDEDVLPLDVPIYFIPGIKNTVTNDEPTHDAVNLLDFMRGEETQVAGILYNKYTKCPLTVVILSSHTKFISIDADGLIKGSVTTLSGQLYEAIKNNTSVGKSIQKHPNDIPSEYWNEQIIANASACIEASGFLRTLMMGRFFDVLMTTKWYERKLFLESSIAAEDMQAFDYFNTLGFPADTDVILVGPKTRCKIYESMMRSRIADKYSITSIFETDKIDQLNILGSLDILRVAGIVP